MRPTGEAARGVPEPANTLLWQEPSYWLWVYPSSERDAMRGTRRCRSACASSSDHAHSKSSVGMPGVPTTVSSLENFVESLDGIHFGKVTGLLQIAKQRITLGIDIRRDVMRDLA